MSTLEMHSARKKVPKPTESVEEAALKAWGPMPRALLIVTSAFLSSNSDWWVHQGGGGGGGYSSEETGSVWWWKTLCSSPISPVRGLTRGIQGRGAFAAPSVDTGLVSLPPPTPTTTTTSHLQNTPQPPHLICSLLSSWPQWTAMLLPLLTPPLRASTASCTCFLCCLLLS